jgi:hypothetical protein
MQMEKAPTFRTKAARLATVVAISAAAVIFTASPSWASPEPASVTPSSGPSGGGNSVSIALTAGSPTYTFVQGNDTVVFWGGTTGHACAAWATPVTNTNVAPADVRVITSKLLAVTVPTAVTTGNGRNSADNGAGDIYSVCVYDTTTASTGSANALIAKIDAGYTVGATPTVSSISPKTAPAQGGGQITILGTGLGTSPGTTTVSIGGTTVTGNITQSNGSFVGDIPAHVAGGPFPIVISVPNGGVLTVPNAFTYTNGVVVSPTTSPNTRARTDLDVRGIGFAAMNFATTNGVTPNDNNAHVYLVKGNYDPTKSNSVKANGQAAECLNVMPISDTELVCSLFLGGVPLSNAHSVTGTVAGNVFTATTGTFTLGDVLSSVTGANSIPAGTAVASLTDPTHAVLTKSATTNITTPTALSINGSRSFSDATLTAGSPTITSPTAIFNAADIGRVVSGSNIPAGTTITAVASATSATMSANATNTASGSYTITNNTQPVPPGTYTVTVVNNGGVDVQPGGTNIAGPDFIKSIITSGSTFTVADY